MCTCTITQWENLCYLKACFVSHLGLLLLFQYDVVELPLPFVSRLLVAVSMEVGCAFQFGALLLQSTSVLLLLLHETLPSSVHLLHLNHRHSNSIGRWWVLA